MDEKLLARELMIDEGLRFKPYLDTVGKVTIGVGRNLTDVGLSQIEVEFLLNNDIKRVLRELDSAIPWWYTLPEDKQRVVANMAFNLGIRGLLKFSKFLAAMQKQDWPTAAKEMENSLWYKQVGGRAEDLKQRVLRG